MAISVKALLIPYDDTMGNGLVSIREKESELIDITDWSDFTSDATNTSNHGFVIKDNKVYKMIKFYFDLDKKCRILMCKETKETMDMIK